MTSEAAILEMRFERERTGPHEFVVRGENIALADDALAGLATIERAEHTLFVRSRELVRIIPSTKAPRGVSRLQGSPVIQLVSTPMLRDRLARIGKWVRVASGPRGKEHEQDTIPPPWLVENILTRAELPFVPLEGVVEAPTIRRDGSLLTEPGYDDMTGLYFYRDASSPRFPLIPEYVSIEDARGALSELLDVVSDFPFRDLCDQAAMIAAILSLIARHAIDGPVPLFVFRSPTPGTGKTLGADIVSLIGTGRPAPRASLDGDDSETRKLVLAVAIQGIQVFLLDNLTGTVGNRTLAAALTAETWQDRLLGQSRIVEAPLRPVWMATGNGLSFRGDLGRRVVLIDIDAKLEHPEDREESSFHYPDLRAHVARKRPMLVTAALTVLRGYHVAGRPKHGAPRIGSFEEWDDLIRGACVWAGLADPCGGRERVRAEDDSDLASLTAALDAVAEAFPNPFTVADLLVRCEADSDLRAVIAELVGGKLEPRPVGTALRGVRGRIAGGRCFERAGRSASRNRSPLWLVKEA